MFKSLHIKNASMLFLNSLVVESEEEAQNAIFEALCSFH